MEVLHFWVIEVLDPRPFHCAFLPACLSMTSIWYCYWSCCSQSAEYAREIRRNADLSIRWFLSRNFVSKLLPWDKGLNRAPFGPSHNSSGMSMAKTSKDQPGVGKGTTTCGRPSWSKCFDTCGRTTSKLQYFGFFPLGLQLLQTTANSLHLQ